MTKDILILIAQLEPKLMNSQKLQPKETPDRSGSALNDNAPSQTSGTRLLRSWPWVWIVLTGFATLIWLVGIGWAAVKLFRWLFD